LEKYGDTVLKKLQTIDKKSQEKIHSSDFSSPISAGLIPQQENYSEWLKGFQLNSEQDQINS
jgi:hypothetical protein